MSDDEKTNPPMASASEAPSADVLTTFKRLMTATSKAERKQLTIELALKFMSEHDPSDFQTEEAYHESFDDLIQARLAYEQAALRVGRLAAHCIQLYLSSSELTLEQAMQDSSSTLN